MVIHGDFWQVSGAVAHPLHLVTMVTVVTDPHDYGSMKIKVSYPFTNDWWIFGMDKLFHPTLYNGCN